MNFVSDANQTRGRNRRKLEEPWAAAAHRDETSAVPANFLHRVMN
jgi:hypothetical protein